MAGYSAVTPFSLPPSRLITFPAHNGSGRSGVGSNPIPDNVAFYDHVFFPVNIRFWYSKLLFELPRVPVTEGSRYCGFDRVTEGSNYPVELPRF